MKRLFTIVALIATIPNISFAAVQILSEPAGTLHGTVSDFDRRWTILPQKGSRIIIKFNINNYNSCVAAVSPMGRPPIFTPSPKGVVFEGPFLAGQSYEIMIRPNQMGAKREVALCSYIIEYKIEK